MEVEYRKKFLKELSKLPAEYAKTIVNHTPAVESPLFMKLLRVEIQRQGHKWK